MIRHGDTVLQEHHAKSEMARQQALETWSDLMSHPLGSKTGENFSVPQNYRIPPARVYVINHSRTREWKRCVIPVSVRQGADDAVRLDKELAKNYSIELVYKEVEKGRDMSRYKTELKPVAFRLRVPGGREVIVPPSKSAEDKPIAVEVPEGTWDLYLGNFDRMRGHTGLKPYDEEPFDQRLKSEEEARLAVSFRQRHNPVFRYTIDGESEDVTSGGVVNPFGILEFVRVTQRAVLEPIDREYLTSLDIMESV